MFMLSSGWMDYNIHLMAPKNNAQLYGSDAYSYLLDACTSVQCVQPHPVSGSLS